jgi:hypothetical protein
MVLGLDFSHAGQEDSFERREFERKLCEDLAFASGWERGGLGAGRPISIPSERLVDVQRSSTGLGIYCVCVKCSRVCMCVCACDLERGGERKRESE